MGTDQSPETNYLLSYRRDNVEEDRRLNSQHGVIQHAILDGRLLHPSIPIAQLKGAIADFGCGTGIWLEDVKATLFTEPHEKSPKLVGFDRNAHAFSQNPVAGVQLIEHDCTKPFNAEYIGAFDLVNMRGLAYALSAEEFSLMLGNAVQLLSQIPASVRARIAQLSQS